MADDLWSVINQELNDRRLAQVGDVILNWIVVAAVEDPRRRETEYVVIHDSDDTPLHVAAGLLHCALKSLDGLEPKP